MKEKDDTPAPAQPLSQWERRLLSVPPLPPEEIARRKLGAQRLKERLGRVPFYAQQAEGDPEYWDNFYASRVLS